MKRRYEAVEFVGAEESAVRVIEALQAELVLLRDAHRMACAELSKRRWWDSGPLDHVVTEQDVDDVQAEFLGKASGPAPEDEKETA